MRDWLPLCCLGVKESPDAEFPGLKSLEKIISTFNNCQGKMDRKNGQRKRKKEETAPEAKR
jgi:hypothetical protein